MNYSTTCNLIVAISLLLIAGCANQKRARNEAILKENLYHIRTAIDQYTQDNSTAPAHLADLVTAHYLKTIPKDPFTNSATTWVEVQEEVLSSIDRTHPGLSDVHSGSALVSSEGGRYSDW
jgi:general secretion pathway protein G